MDFLPKLKLEIGVDDDLLDQVLDVVGQVRQYRKNRRREDLCLRSGSGGADSHGVKTGAQAL